MTKEELIERISKAVPLSKADAGRALNTIIDNIVKALKKGEKLTLIGFGTFHVGKRKARTGRNPRTGEAIKILARKIPKFKAGKAFKDLLK